MRPVCQADLCSDTAIRTEVTSWMAVWLTPLPQSLSFDKAAERENPRCFTFNLNISEDDVQIGTLTAPFPHTVNMFRHHAVKINSFFCHIMRKSCYWTSAKSKNVNNLSQIFSPVCWNKLPYLVLPDSLLLSSKIAWRRWYFICICIRDSSSSCIGYEQNNICTHENCTHQK